MMNYDEWLRAQGEKFQNEALGARAAIRFRNGEKVEKYVEHGKPLTLDELNATHELSLNGE